MDVNEEPKVTNDVLSIRNKACLKWEELKQFRKFESKLAQLIYQGNYEVQLQHAYDAFVKNPYGHSWKNLEEAMYCYQHVKKTMEPANV
jgi:hypothetical protein